MTAKMNDNHNAFSVIEDLMYRQTNPIQSIEELDFKSFEFQTSRVKLEVGNHIIYAHAFPMLYTKATEKLSVFGFDTGNNLGFAWLCGNVGLFGNTVLVKDYSENPYPNVVAYEFAYKFIELFSNYFGLPAPYALIEGSAMQKQPSQEFLSQLRSALFLGAYHVIQDKWLPEGHRRTFQVAPMTARKAVLGNGTKHPTEYHPQYNANAMDALAIAWYGMLRNC